LYFGTSASPFGSPVALIVENMPLAELYTNAWNESPTLGV
jgi:hypothetical protein